MKKILPSLILLCFIANAQAGIHSPTAHSRANCGNNESITWYLKDSYWWRVISYHYYTKNPSNPNAPHHTIDTGKGYTWRQAAVHWGESVSGGNYYVMGIHYYYPNGQETFDAKSEAVDCSGYDGWWDY